MRIIVVGAGVAGLSAARRLTERHDVTVLERNGVVGGRLGTMRVGAATFDAGAQFFTARSEVFRAQADAWIGRGVATVWCHGFAVDDGHPRYVGTGGMSGLARDLAEGLDVRTDRMVFTLRRLEDGWQVVLDDASTIECDAVVLTCPIPQAWSLLAESDVEIPDDLARTPFHRIVALLVTLDRPSRVPEPGAVQLDPASTSATFGFVADNQRKGVSAVPAVTLHTTWSWSEAHWRDDDDLIRRILVDAAAEWFDSGDVADATVRRWHFAAPTRPWPEPCWDDEERMLVVAGDLFDGPKVEGAYLSGCAAADLIDRLDRLDRLDRFP
jgi:renalase